MSKKVLVLMALILGLAASSAQAVTIPVMVFAGTVKLEGTGFVLSCCNGTAAIKGIGNLHAKGNGYVELPQGAEYMLSDGVWQTVEKPVFKLVLKGEGQIAIRSNGKEVKVAGKGATWFAGKGEGIVLLDGYGIYRTDGFNVTDGSAQ